MTKAKLKDVLLAAVGFPLLLCMVSVLFIVDGLYEAYCAIERRIRRLP